jgi:hypothetical protein
MGDIMQKQQMPGTIQPPAGTNLSTLNPCPLNICCNIWGQCGLTDDFCVISKSATGAPGTSAPGKNGCTYPGSASSRLLHSSLRFHGGIQLTEILRHQQLRQGHY